MTIVIYSDRETASPPIDVDAEWSEAISDACINKIDARAKAHRGAIKFNRALTWLNIDLASQRFAGEEGA